MNPAAASVENSTGEPALFVSIELSNSKWDVGSKVNFGQKPRCKPVPAGDVASLEQELCRAKKRFGLPDEAPVLCCYEAGRDGFWLHRFLESIGVNNVVVDPGSLSVGRKKNQRRKTDRLDLNKLLEHLMRFHSGEKGVWSVVRVPSDEAEQNRQLHRERESLQKECTRLNHRILGLLVVQGLKLKVTDGFLEQLKKVTRWDGSLVPQPTVDRLEMEFERWQLAKMQFRRLEAKRRALLKERGENPTLEKVVRLSQLGGIGVHGSWVLVMEMFGWRQFKNRKEVGSLTGLTSAPYDSGQMKRDQGIDKCGIRRVRSLLVELAWGWLRYQPQSALSLWFQERYGPGTRRSRRVGIVALARKLAVALWRYLEQGVLPEGARLKS